MWSSTTRVPPDDALLSYGGYVSIDVNEQHARMTRDFGGDGGLSWFGFAAEQSAGGRVRWRTDAARVEARVLYRRACNERCAIDLDHKSCYQNGRCHAECEAVLLVDGQRVDAACHASGGQYSGEQLCRTTSETSQVRDYELIFPWAAAIDFLGLNLLSSTVGTAELVAAEPWLSSSRLRYVAYGDSITHGWCGRGPSYAEALAAHVGYERMEPINMGIQGLSTGKGLMGRHGDAVGALQPDLITIMLGINDVLGGGRSEAELALIGRRVGQITAETRRAAPGAVIAVITPIACAWLDVEPLRAEIRQQVLPRPSGEARLPINDPRLLLVEGGALLPQPLLLEGLHPTSEGKQAIAAALYAELGFSPIHRHAYTCTYTYAYTYTKVRRAGVSPIHRHAYTCTYTYAYTYTKVRRAGLLTRAAHAHELLPL